MLWQIDIGAREGLAGQIAANVRRGLVDGDLAAGDPLPTSSELAHILSVNPNTVLAAYRALRDEGLLDFRRGRGVRVRPDIDHDIEVLQAARSFARIASRFGYTADDLPELLRRAGTQ